MWSGKTIQFTVYAIGLLPLWIYKLPYSQDLDLAKMSVVVDTISDLQYLLLTINQTQRIEDVRSTTKTRAI